MERDNLYHARRELIYTFEKKIMKGLKVHPLDKRALVEFVQEEIESYRNGLIDRLSTHKQLVPLISISSAGVQRYLLELPHQQWDFRAEILKRQRSQDNYKRNLANLSQEKLKERNCKTAITRNIANKEALRKKNGFIINEMVIPLFIRGASNQEIVEITGLSFSQITIAIKNFRHRSNYKDKPPQIIFRSSPQLSTDTHSLIFLKELLKHRLVPVTIKYWGRLHDLYNQYHIELPESFAEKVLFETFLVSRMYAEYGKKHYLEKYIQCGIQTESEWFKNKLQLYENSLMRTSLAVKQEIKRI